MPPATATPSATLICCDTAEIAVAWLASLSSMSANTSALVEVKNSERKKPAPISTAMITADGVCGVNQPLMPMKQAAGERRADQHIAEAAEPAA